LGDTSHVITQNRQPIVPNATGQLQDSVLSAYITHSADKVNRNNKFETELDSSGLRPGPVAGSCDYGNEISGSTQNGKKKVKLSL
jgi:hypothetical protein